MTPLAEVYDRGSKPLQGRRILVTGAAKRIGRVLALTLAEAGADVAITYRGSVAQAGATAAELERFGGRTCAVMCDVLDVNSVESAIAESVDRLGGLDMLVNNAGGV